jgi:integrase/recombinase XerD
MIARVDFIKARPEASLYHLKVVLLGSKPPVWRRLQVPGDADLGWLHSVQVLMGRDGYKE